MHGGKESVVAKNKPSRWPFWTGELAAYYCLVGAYFFSYGVQFVLYPSLIAFTLGEPGAKLGAAQLALSGPMFVLLLATGVYAERAQAGPSLFMFQLAMAAPPLLVAWLTQAGVLNYSVLLGYGVMMGTVGAFILPVRDAALNGVITREAERGRRVQLTVAATTITVIQIGAQIGGILLGELTDRIGPTPLLVIQGAVSVIGAFFALRLKAPRPDGPRRSAGHLFRDLIGGMAYVLRDRVVLGLLWSGAYAGIFIVGSGLVLFPLIVRDEYKGGAHELSLLYACFWAACFVSAALLSRFGGLDRPGRGLILAHLASAGALASFAFDTPLWGLYIIVTVWGLVSGVAISTNRTIIQALTQHAYLGRVLALYSMGFMGGAPIGGLLAGFAADRFGPREAALAPAIGLACAALLLVAFSPVWRVHRPDGDHRAA